jgi:hypothetical protein
MGAHQGLDIVLSGYVVPNQDEDLIRQVEERNFATTERCQLDVKCSDVLVVRLKEEGLLIQCSPEPWNLRMLKFG